jgi:sulfopyruvate decarboxylase subunit beta
MKRVDALLALSSVITSDDLFIAALGATRNDWWNVCQQGAANTMFLSGMGTVSPAALGLAIALPHRRVVSLDTDGSMLMNASAMCTLGSELVPNLTVMVLDNGVYESIGVLPTHTSGRTDLAKMAEGAGCVNCMTVTDVEALSLEAKRLLNDDQFGFLVARIEPGIHKWPTDSQKTSDGMEDKYRFLRHIEQMEGISLIRGAKGPFV